MQNLRKENINASKTRMYIVVLFYLNMYFTFSRQCRANIVKCSINYRMISKSGMSETLFITNKETAIDGMTQLVLLHSFVQ